MGNIKELVTTSVFERDTVTHEYTQMDEINMGWVYSWEDWNKKYVQQFGTRNH